jgi:hypothetical protein
MLGVLVGGLLSGIFVLVGLVVAGATEHRRWLRDQRFGVWGELLALHDEVVFWDQVGLAASAIAKPERGEGLSGDDVDVLVEARRLIRALHGMSGRLLLVGPPEVAQDAVRVVRALGACMASGLSNVERDSRLAAAETARYTFGGRAAAYLARSHLRD